MTRLLILPCLLLSLLLAACSGATVQVKVNPAPTSNIRIVTDEPDPQDVSLPGDKHAINMHVGDQLHYRILRTVTPYHSAATTTDVTAHSDFNFTNPPVAAMDVTGQLTAFQAGFTTLEVVYRGNKGDPTTDDKVALDITVVP